MAREEELDDGWRGQLLHQAALFDNVGLLKSLLEGPERCNLDACDRMGRTVIYTAVSNNSLKCLKLLLANGANPNTPAGERYNKMTPLHSAICDNKEEAVRILLLHADLDLTDMSGLTPVEVARSLNNPIIIAMIQGEIERRKIRMHRIFKTFSELCANGETEKVRELLAENRTDLRRILSCVPKGGFPALASAVKSGSYELVELLLELGARPIPHTENGLTPLHLACETGSVELVIMLMKKFVDLCIHRTVDHQLPIHRAAACGRADILEYLLNFPYPNGFLHSYVDPRSGRFYYSSIDVNPVDSTGMTPLHLAAETGSLEAVKLLLEHQAKLEEEEEPLDADTYKTFQRMASNASECHSFGFDKEMDPYKIYPVDRDMKSNEGLTALHYAIKNHHPDIAQILVKGMTDLGNMVLVEDTQLSYLAYALEKGDPEVFELLLRHGAQDTENIALKRAHEANNKEIILLLLQHKTSRDHIHSINKVEMKRAYADAYRHGMDSISEQISSSDPDFRRMFPTCPVAVNWHRQQLDNIDKLCLIRACFVHNLSMRQIDNNVTALYAITKIDISHNYFSELPKIIFELPSLHVLHASENRIKKFPLESDLEHSIEILQIEELHIQENSLEMLPSYLFRLPALKYFNVSRNCLKMVPKDMWTAPALNHLNLAQNDLTDLPHWEISDDTMSRRGTITSVTSDSSDTDGAENDSGFCLDNSFHEIQENSVTHFDRWRQRLTVSDLDARKRHENMTGIRNLNLAGNKFSTIPYCLACCAPHLEILNMTDNKLESVGPLGNLPQSLMELNLCRTGLTSLYSWMQAALQDQPCYGLSKSILSSPSQFRMSPRSHSPSASSLSSFSPLQAINSCPHRCHQQLPRLEKLNLSHNMLESIILTKICRTVNATSMDNTAASFSMESDEIQSRLLFPNLSELDVYHNSLACLPSDIGELTSLKVLTLSRNPLKELPPKLGLLKKLWKLELELCPLDGVIQDMIKSSRYPTKDILGFLLSVLEESTEYNCMNLMIVGSHEIGKTSLLQRLNKEGRLPNKATHWRDRVSNSSEAVRPRGQTLSTVGIDINELIIERRSKGAVNFRTWDFGGQREYYATHQYFLSPRSLYLVLWNITHGPKGVESLMQWLVNIQARAPGSPVIIVGTHLDKLEDRATRRTFPDDFEEAMMGLVEKNFILVKEPEKCGLPNILCTINVSCKSGKHVSTLVDMIYEQAFELRHPRSRTQKLLKQKIPKKYLLLQNVVIELAQERLRENKEPVLSKSKYMLCVANKMMEKAGTTFRDVQELDQATRFLHENGVLFHYEDLSLKDLYFLDPQWLCDQLAKVVTIKEINSFASRGIMKIKNLELLFKNSLQPMDIQRDITSLLNKFEVALQFDEENLLLPSLLPMEEELHACVQKKCDVRIPMRRPEDDDCTQVKRRSKPFTTDVVYVKPDTKPLSVGKSTFFAGPQPFDEGSLHPDTPDLLLLGVKATNNPVFSFCRLYFMTYFPSGFWPRLITRVLADSFLYQFAVNLFKLPEDLMQRSPGMKNLFDTDPEWRCWQTGLVLNYLGFEMLRIREVLSDSTMGFCDYSLCRIRCNVESDWSFLDVINSKILEISLPTDSLTFHLTNKAGPQIQTLDPTNRTTLYRDDSAAARLLGKLIEHIDNLLQDWYPEIGEVRFSQNCEGRYLITRIVPCPQCLFREIHRQRKMKKELDDDAWFWMNPEVPEQCSSIFISQEEMALGEPDSNSDSEDEDGNEEKKESGITTVRENMRLQTGQAIIYNRPHRRQETEAIIYSHLVERCMLDILEGVNICCPVHASVSPAHLLGPKGQNFTFHVAPDLGFRDVDRDLMITETDRLDIGRRLGKGTFGEVFAGNLFRRGEEPPLPVAVKVLFSSTREEAKLKRQSIESRMDKACQAYLTARQEISILESILHPNIVPMLGLAVRPLSLILSLAPHGSLDSTLKTLNENGQRLPLLVIRQVIIQIAQALSYLHDRNIIYRDLKSENVLVWSLPLTMDSRCQVDVKLADYGISRSVMPTGAKGFGGTPPFIAPEILQHAGKDTYTEKVDIFSFGMCMFELITCRQPFAEVNNPSTLVCQGSRPSITVQEVNLYPCCVLDLMTVCWSQDPDERPSAASILAITRSPQFCHLRDVVSLGSETRILCSCSVPARDANEYLLSPTSPGSPGIDPELLSNCSQTEPETRAQIWLSACLGPRYYIDILSYNRWSHCVDSKTIMLPGAEVTAMSVINNYVWCVDAQGNVMVFSSESQQKVLSYKLPVMVVPQVHGLYYAPRETVIVITLKSGQIFVHKQPKPGPLSDFQPDSYTTQKNYSSCFVNTGDSSEIWLGQDGGRISIWDLSDRKVRETFSHPEPVAGNKCCKFLVAAKPPNSQETLVWSYVYPGVLVYRWDVKAKTVIETLDCSRVAPSTYAPNLDSPRRGEGANKYQVTAMNVLGDYLYLGTTLGNIIVTDAATLKPLSVFKCHCDKEFYIKSVLPLLSEEGVFQSDNTASGPGIVTLGRGYVDIIRDSQVASQKPRAESDPPDPESRPRAKTVTQDVTLRDPTVHHSFVLSWWASEWEYY